jgi:hypothetical protein
MELSVDGVLSRILDLTPEQQSALLAKWRRSRKDSSMVEFTCQSCGNEHPSEGCTECAVQIVIEEIDSSTGPTGGWLDSPKTVCAKIVARLLQGYFRPPVKRWE